MPEIGRENLRAYNPGAISDLSATFSVAASVTIFFAIIAGIAVAAAGLLLGEVISIILGLTIGALVFLTGYVVSLFLNGAAQLLLAIVEIEANTAISGLKSGENRALSQGRFRGNMQSKTPAVPVLSKREVMEKYGITYDGEKYHYLNYRYDRLKDAVNYAKKQTEI